MQQQQQQLLDVERGAAGLHPNLETTTRKLSTLKDEHQDSSTLIPEPPKSLSHLLRMRSSDQLLPLLVGDDATNGRKKTVQLHLAPGAPSNSTVAANNNNIPVSPSITIVYEPILLHRVLLHIPLHIRFGMNGILSNVLFMAAYNYAIATLPPDFLSASTIYSTVYLIFIPISHLMVSLLVFGWPERYLQSLLSNLPVGITAIALGAALTAYLDSIEFNSTVANYIMDNFQFSQMPPRTKEMEHQRGEFYSSLVIIFVTSLWTYILSVYVNSSPGKTKTN